MVALESLRTVRAWLDAWSVEGAAAPPVAAASVTLLLGGELVARAKVIAPPGSDGHGVLEEAAILAMAQAAERLRLTRDALYEERARAAGRSLHALVELGGVPVPMEVETFERAAALISPGVGGVGARMGAKQALVFPSAMLISSMDPSAALRSAGAEALGEAEAALSEAPAMARRGVRFLAFECIAVAEVGEDRAAMILDRGGRVFEQRDVSSAMLRDLGARIADHAARPDADSGQSPAGLTQATLAYALARWSAVPGAGNEAQRTAWRRRAGAMVARAAPQLGEASPAAAALWMMAEAAVSGQEWVDPERASGLALARGSAGEVVVRAIGASTGEAPAPLTAALLAWAGAHRAGVLGDGALLDRSDDLLRSAYARTPAGEWVGLLPWAGWAEHEIERAKRRLGRVQTAIPGATALRETRDLVWRHQIGASDVNPGDRDLVGGIVFTRGRQALPTWQSLRPLAYLATMMGDAGLTPEAEFPGQVLRMLASLRFLRQLCADEHVMAWAGASGARPWGVRASLWTADQPPEATALALLTIGETLRSLEAVAERRQSERPSPVATPPRP